MLKIDIDKDSIDALQEDRDKRWAVRTAALAQGGITRNQYLNELGFDGIGPAGDKFLVPSTMVPLDDVIAGATENTPPDA
jgi:hypothetical protein